MFRRAIRESRAVAPPLAVVALAVVAPTAASAASAEFQRHPVRTVPGADRLVVVYAGLPVTVRLAHLVLPQGGQLLARSRAAVESLVKSKQVRVAYCPEAGLDANGLPQVYVTAGAKNVNAELVRQGLARYEPGEKRSRLYHAKMALADTAARKARAGVWAGGGASTAAAAARPADGASPALSTPDKAPSAGAATRIETAGVVYSELNSSNYHLPTCRWALRMSPQRRIRYRSVEAAERAGKGPCWVCMAERAKTRAFGGAAKGRGKVEVVRAAGPIVGSEGVFHAPNCKRVLGKAAKDLNSFTAVRDAKAAGLRPCNTCLRLGGGPIPLPGRGECIGRAPPHRRPCRRAPADASGLCPYCQGKGE